MSRIVEPVIKPSKLMLQLDAKSLSALAKKGLTQAQFESLFEKEKVSREQVRGLCFVCWRMHGRGETKRCDRCHTIKYCGPVCQRADWVGTMIN